jgi:hypothetical protein
MEKCLVTQIYFCKLWLYLIKNRLHEQCGIESLLTTEFVRLVESSLIIF